MTSYEKLLQYYRQEINKRGYHIINDTEKYVSILRDLSEYGIGGINLTDYQILFTDKQKAIELMFKRRRRISLKLANIDKTFIELYDRKENNNGVSKLLQDTQ